MSRAATRAVGSTTTDAPGRTDTGSGARVGDSARRPDGIPKVKGHFAFSSDLVADEMLWGRTLRSPHPRARIRSIELGPALSMTGVHAVLTADDVPGRPHFGLETADQPVLADGEVRYLGEAVAVVAADHPEIARRAAEAIVVHYEPLDPVVDPDIALVTDPIHPDGNVVRHLVIRHGDPSIEGDVTVEGTYEVGMQDQAPMGTEAGLAVPSDDGGVELFVSTQFLHVDRNQIAAQPRMCTGHGPPDPRRRRRRIRRPGGLLAPDPPVPARTAHRSAGEDGLRPR